MKQHKFRRAGLLLALTMVILPRAQASPAPVDVSALNGIGTTVSLAAGAWDVNYVKGTYTAWNPWSSDSAVCNADHTCKKGISTGWLNALQVSVNSSTTSYGDGLLWETADFALTAAQAFGPIHLDLTSPSDVRFWIPDYPYTDNRDGLSLSISAAAPPATSSVPEPQSLALGLTALACMTLVRRQRGTA